MGLTVSFGTVALLMIAYIIYKKCFAKDRDSIAIEQASVGDYSSNVVAPK